MTRSRITGNARIGVTVIVSDSSKSESRVMHSSRGLAVDLGAAGAALAGLAVPADGEVAGLGRLDAVDGVEHHLAALDTSTS